MTNLYQTFTLMSLFATRQSGWKMVQDISSCVNRFRRINEALCRHSCFAAFKRLGFCTFVCNQTPLNIPYFIFSVHSLQLTLSWPNKQFNCLLTTDSCTFICWKQTGLIYAWPIALSRFILFSREKSKTKESEIGELYFGLLQSIFVVSKFGIYLTWPVAHDKAKCLSCLDDDTLSRLREGGNFQTGDRLW